MDCPDIQGLRFDQKSIQAIDTIKRKYDLVKYGAIAIGVGGLIDIFFKNGPVVATDKVVRQFEWELFAHAMRGVPQVTKDAIVKDAQLQMLEHLNDYKQKIFWEAVANGCRIK